MLRSLFPTSQPHNEKAVFVSIRNLQVYVFKLDTGTFNRGVAIRNSGLIATIGLPLPTIEAGIGRLGLGAGDAVDASQLWEAPGPQRRD